MALANFSDWLNRKPAGPKPKKRLNRTQVRRVSKKRLRDGAKYSAKRQIFLREHRLCEACWPIKQGLADRSTEVHHRHGRIGANYLDESTWIAVCAPCHRWVHEHPGQARKLALLK